MAGATNWLTFSLTPIDSHFVPFDTSSQCFVDNFYGNATSQNHSLNFFLIPGNLFPSVVHHNPRCTSSKGVMESQSGNQALVVPKVEDFFESQTETQENSSLTHVYDHGSASAYFSDLQDLNAIPGLQAFPELDDSAYDRTRVAPTELSYKGGLSLCVAAHGSDSEVKAIVAVENDTHKKVLPNNLGGQRTSIYRGVTRHRWTGRYEAHLWDNSCRREGQARKGRQVEKCGYVCKNYSKYKTIYSPSLSLNSFHRSVCILSLALTFAFAFHSPGKLGLTITSCGYDKEEKAARAYDLAAIKYWGPTATTNFPIANYTKELEEMKHAGKQEFIASLRRKSSGFSRGASAYRGVTRHHQQGRWQARIGRVAGNKDLYLGTFATEEEAAEAYDIAAIKFRGSSAVTNFEMSRYDVEAILNSSLPVGGVAKRLKLSPESETKAPINSSTQQPEVTNVSSSINFSNIQPLASIPFDPAHTCYPHNLFHQFHPTNGASSTAESSATVTNANATTLTTLPPPPPLPGFFIWPHHQSYN
uniref:AP2-like ethylene-responsive transcription factor AIL6 n=1 Tax=Cajanus cajan TaxID=3821 RepID=A0A151TGR2_CAJCA|nr:AP2-like ethylene-responsive transcription factor AIL6 [Cajanus cajan]